MSICCICGAKHNEWPMHRCNPRRLAKIDAAHRRATDDHEPDDMDEGERCEAWEALTDQPDSAALDRRMADGSRYQRRWRPDREDP